MTLILPDLWIQPTADGFAAVPNLFGTRDQFNGKQLLHGLRDGGGFSDDSNALHLLCTLLLLHQLHLRWSCLGAAAV